MGLALTAAYPYGKARACRPSGRRIFSLPDGVFSPMVKPEWGSKRTCPKCGTRFYDLGKEDPVTCIQCGVAWDPEPVLKSKQPLPYDAPKKEIAVDEKEDADLAADELAIDEDVEENPDDEIDLGGDDDVGVPGTGDDEEDV
jgi:uncharacterized protein (TIGR02300 family)